MRAILRGGTRISRILLDLVYPRSCHGCGGGTSPNRSLCWDCLRTFPLLRHPFCRVCGNPVSGAVDHEYVCTLCGREPPAYHRARSAARHDGGLQQCLLDYKYNRALWLTRDLVDLLEGAYRAHFEDLPPDMLVPVPLHAARRRHRGYNQAALLAGGLARRLGRPCQSRLLQRIRPTPTQTHLTAGQRLANVRGAFRCKHPKGIEHRTLLLIDDVMTTGSTVHECARVLVKAGAAQVNVLTVARR